MAAPKNNKNALKWTLEKSKKLFEEAIELTTQQEENGAAKYDFIGEVAREMGYYKSIFTELVKKYPDQLSTYHKRLIENLEANCYCNTKKGHINTAVGIVNLKSNHRWTDRQEIKADIPSPIHIIQLPDNKRKNEEPG